VHRGRAELRRYRRVLTRSNVELVKDVGMRAPGKGGEDSLRGSKYASLFVGNRHPRGNHTEWLRGSVKGAHSILTLRNVSTILPR